MLRSHPALLVLPLALLFALPGCQQERYNTEGRPLPAGRAELWKTMRRVVERQFYAIDKEKSDEKAGELVTEWYYDMSREYLRSYRRQVRMQLVSFEADKDLPESQRRWQVKIGVVKQVNQNIDDPRNIEKADWGDEDFDTDAERQLLMHLEMEHRPIASNIPRTEGYDSGFQPSEDGAWLLSSSKIVEQQAAWDTLKGVARSQGYEPRTIKSEIGYLESDWVVGADYVEEPKLALQRSRLIAQLVSETTDEATFQRVKVRVEQQERDDPRSPWRDAGRADVDEVMVCRSIDEALAKQR